MQTLSTAPAYFVINSEREYQSYPINDRSLLQIFNSKKDERIRLPVSARCHRILKDDKFGHNKENTIKQGQVLNVYYKYNSDNQQQSKHTRTHSTIKKSGLGFDIDRNFQSIDKSMFLYQKYNNYGNFSSRKQNPHGPLQQILFKSSTASVSSQLNSSTGVIKQKKSRLKAYKQKLKDNISQQESAVIEIVDNKSSRYYSNSLMEQHVDDRHTPHWLLHKRSGSNYQVDNNENKRSIIEGVMVLDRESLQLGEEIVNSKQPQQQTISLLTLPKNKIITHLLTQSQRQLPGQKYHQKITNLNPKPCQSLILEPQSIQTYTRIYYHDQQKVNTEIDISTEEFYQQEMKRRQQADYILRQLTSLEILK